MVVEYVNSAARWIIDTTVLHLEFNFWKHACCQQMVCCWLARNASLLEVPKHFKIASCMIFWVTPCILSHICAIPCIVDMIFSKGPKTFGRSFHKQSTLLTSLLRCSSHPSPRRQQMPLARHGTGGISWRYQLDLWELLWFNNLCNNNRLL